MINSLPAYISVTFIITTILTLAIAYWAMKQSKNGIPYPNSIKIVVGMILWLILQAIISINDIYSNDLSFIPPKIFLFGILPTIIVGIWLFTTKTGKAFIDNLDIKKLTYLNLVRIPVEFVLLWLFLNKAIPQILTFEGWNFDIVMGLTAPLIIYFGYTKGSLSKNILIAWNIIGVLLLTLVFTLAILSSPFPLQQLGFEQPNLGLLEFPFSWLPTFIVPVVILAHLVSIRRLRKK